MNLSFIDFLLANYKLVFKLLYLTEIESLLIFVKVFKYNFKLRLNFYKFNSSPTLPYLAIILITLNL